MTDLRIRPCQYPACKDQYGEKRLTSNVICDPCRTRYHRLLEWIANDYLDLATRMPKPATQETPHRRQRRISYGHEREWASNTLHEIRTHLVEAENYVRQHLNEPLTSPHKREYIAVAQAINYLLEDTHPDRPDTLHAPKFDALCRMYLSGDKAQDLITLHKQIRYLTGRTLIVKTIPYPCPSCDTQSVQHWPGGGRDYMQCGYCGEIIEEKHYGLHARIATDDLIAQYDALNNT